MTNPKQMNANYRRNERLLESNPTPIDIGLSEDVKDYIDSQITEELPAYTTSYDGKVLGVTVDSSGETPVAELEWTDVPNELPAIASGDAGKVLTVNSGETGTEWADASSGLPAIVSGDAGKVLAVNSGETGTEWKTLLNSNLIYVGSVKSSGTFMGGQTLFDSVLQTAYDNYHDDEHAIIIIPVIDGDVDMNCYITSGYRKISGNSISSKNVYGYRYQWNSLKIYNSSLTCVFLIFKVTPTTEYTVNSVYCMGLNNQPKMNDCKELPHDIGTAGQVLAVNSGATGVEWVNPAGMTPHTFTSWADAITAFDNNPNMIIMKKGTGICYGMYKSSSEYYLNGYYTTPDSSSTVKIYWLEAHYNPTTNKMGSAWHYWTITSSGVTTGTNAGELSISDTIFYY